MILMLAPLLLGLGDAPDVPPTVAPSTERFIKLTLNSAWVASIAAVVSLLWAVVSAHALARGPAWGLRVITPLAVLPVVVSSPVIAVAAIRLFGPMGLFSKLLFGDRQSFPVSESIMGVASRLPIAPLYSLMGCGFVLAWVLSPLALLICLAGFKTSSPDLEDAARLEAGPFQRFVGVLLPLLLPVFALAGAVVFLFAFLEFGIPESLRSQPVLVAEIYVQAAVFYNTSAATLTGIVALAVVLIPVIALLRIIGNREESESVAVSTQGRLSTLAAAPGLILAVLPTLMMVGALWFTSSGPHGRLEVWKTVWDTAQEEIIKSYLLSLFAAVLIVAVGFLLGSAFFFLRSKVLLYALLLPPFLIPGTLLGVSLLVLLRLPGGVLGDFFYGFAQSHGPLILLWIVKFSPLVALLLIAHWRRLFNGDVLDSMRLEGIGPIAAIWRFFLPTSAGPLMLCLLVAFALTMGEVGGAVMLMPPGITNVSIRLLTLMHYAPDGQVSTLCLILIAPVLLAAFALAAFPPLWYTKKPLKEQAKP